MADMVSFACLMICAMANKIFFPYPLLVAFHKQIKRKWPVRSDVQSIRGKIGAIKDADRMEETQNMRKLIKIEEDLGKLNEQRLGVNQNKRQCSKGFDLMERIKEIQDVAPMEVPDKMQTFIDIGEEIRRLGEPGLEVYRIKRQFPERLVLENLEEDMEEMQDTTEARREETEEKEKRFEDVRKEMQRLRRQLEEMEKKLEDTRKENQRLLHRPLEEMKKKLEDMRKENQRLKKS
ncbi:inner centromere protein-like [Durio zibethinus]|uniref:Inner centromere protein-like n=1 Tax=Durio zibethinus TaxID=66656 RepID=A0A6P5Z2V4_DURZI|nr:inner centromere protein-like [Durio zibethinus]